VTIQGALTPAIQLAGQNGARFPNESGGYRQARDALLAEEIELRRHIERVAVQRRASPPGGLAEQPRGLPLSGRACRPLPPDVGPLHDFGGAPPNQISFPSGSWNITLRTPFERVSRFVGCNPRPAI
jgi:hypothetical protein